MHILSSSVAYEDISSCSSAEVMFSLHSSVILFVFKLNIGTFEMSIDTSCLRPYPQIRLLHGIQSKAAISLPSDLAFIVKQ